jgi:Tol biopolymer transport system component
MGDTDTADVQVYLIHPDGSGRRKLTEESSAARNPAWSPDGELVYIRGYQDGLGPMRLQAVAIDQQGGNPRVLTESLAAFTGWSPAWSPDGQSLLFLDVLNEDWAITRLTPATMQFDTLGLAHGNRPGDWKPDGRQIVFGTGDLWLMAPDGSQARTVLADGAMNFEAAWTPAAPSAP